MSKNKSFSAAISERYALALYDLSKDQNQIDEFELSMNNFMKIYESNEDLKSFVKNPTYSTSSQQKVFEKITSLMNFNKTIKNFKPDTIFHLAEFSRIVPSFVHINQCWKSNTIGTFEVLKFCLKNNAKL